MKFGFFTHMPWPEDTSPDRIIGNTTEQIQYAESLGFYSAWLAEHHFTRYCMGASTLVIAANLAAHTKSIRLGTAVLVSPLHNPLRLAEDIATLDLLSAGRVDVGFGRGSGGYEYHGYNVEREGSQKKFQESIKILEGVWTTPEFSFDGEYFQVNKVNLVPPPVQSPHPPIYIAATRTPETLDFAVSTGHNLCIAVVQDTSDALDLCQRFAAKSVDAGFNVPVSDIPFFRYCYVAETEQQAIDDTRERLNWVVDIMQWRNNIPSGSELHLKIEDWRSSRSEQPATYEYLNKNRAVIGTPEQCVAQINEFRKIGIDYFGCNFDFGGMPHDKVLRSMDLFAKEVMPKLV